MQDLDFNRRELTVRNGKGGKDRRTMLPERLAKKLRNQLEGVRGVHKRDLMDGWGQVRLPDALARKYRYVVGLAVGVSPASALAGSNTWTRRRPSS